MFACVNALRRGLLWPSACSSLVEDHAREKEDCSTVPLLDITHSASSLLPLTLSVSLPPLFCLPGVKSSLIYCIRHVSVFPSFPPFFSPTSPPRHYLANSEYPSPAKASLSLFICARLSPSWSLGWIFFVFSPSSYLHSHIPSLTCPNLCSSPLLLTLLTVSHLVLLLLVCLVLLLPSLSLVCFGLLKTVSCILTELLIKVIFF